MKGVLKESKEQVIKIKRCYDDHGITRKQGIYELGLSHTAYYYTLGLLSEEELHRRSVHSDNVWIRFDTGSLNAGLKVKT